MKAGLRQNTTTLFVYMPGSKHRTADQWFLDTQRSTESNRQQLTWGLPQGRERTALQQQHQLSSQLHQWLKPGGHSSAQNSTKPPSQRFPKLGEGHRQADSL